MHFIYRTTMAIVLVFLFAIKVMALEPTELRRLRKLTTADKITNVAKISELRPNAIKETAYALAVQHAVKWRYDQINQELEKHAGELDRIFDFNAHLLHAGMMMPPIVVEAGPAQRLENNKLSVYTDATYKIIEDARLLTTPPDWRTYLIQYYDAVNDVHPSLYPKNSAERRIWEQAVEEGWSVGVQHAQYLFDQGLNRLKRDICGIIRYRILALQGIVNVPLIATAQTGTEISEKRRKLQLSKTVVRMVKGTTFMDEEKWFPAAQLAREQKARAAKKADVQGKHKKIYMKQ